MHRAAGALMATFLVGNANAQGAPPWIVPGRVPLPEEARSVEILRRDEPLYAAPSATAPRRGAAALGARLPLYGVKAGAGCRGEWLLVGPSAWVCSDSIRISEAGALPAGAGPPSPSDGMPHRYYFVGSEGTLGYGALASAEQTRPTAELQPGFAVAVLREDRSGGGDVFGLTTKGLWLPLRDLKPVSPSTFEGNTIEGGRLDRGWVVADATKLYREPAGKKLDEPPKRRQESVDLLEVREEQGRTWIRIADGAWLEGNDVRWPRLAAPPPEARPGERWIDVDLESQVLTAYEGERPVFATLVSTGRGQGQDPTATPLGVHRVWVKLRTTDMTNLEEDEALRYYAMEEVPWVLFFEKGYGLHGAFWHRSFGRRRSHGCVNLSPRDAARLFRWSSPALPAGWTAVLPTDYDPGTLVRVR